MTDLMKKIEEQVRLADEYGFQELFLRVPITEARELINTFGRGTFQATPVATPAE